MTSATSTSPANTGCRSSRWCCRRARTRRRSRSAATAYVDGRHDLQFRFPQRASVAEAKRAVGERLEQRVAASAALVYRLRDWGVSRQRYWGCPIPVIHCPVCGIVPVPRRICRSSARGRHLRPARATRSTIIRPGSMSLAPLRRPGDARDRHARHFCRFVLVLPALLLAPAAPIAVRRASAADYWMPVDQYIGGVEHAVLHLLYSRFFTRALDALRLSRSRRAVRRAVHSGHGVPPDLSQNDAGEWLFPEEVETDCGGRLVDRQTAGP